MDQRTRAHAASAAIVGIFLLVQLGALALVDPFQAAGYQAVDDPQDPTNSVLYLVAIVIVTALMLAAIKLEITWLIRLGLVGAGAYIGLFVFRVVLPPVVTVPIAGAELNVVAWAAAAVLGAALYFYPEWYVIDAAGIVMGAGAAGMFGISFGVLPAILLLVVLAVYDAVSVYGTEHMLTLASGVMDLKVPIVLVVPLSLSYSYLSGDTPDPGADDAPEGETAEGPTDAVADGSADAPGDSAAEDAAPADAGAATPDDAAEEDAAAAPNGGEEPDPLDREALFIGLGDAVIPSVLVASAAFFAPASVPAVDLLGVSASLPALTAMLGTSVGLVILLRMVLRGRPHAGLPLLNGGTIAGYLVGALASGMGLAQALGLEQFL